MAENLSLSNNLPELIPVSRFNDFVPYPTVGAIRQYIFANTNGFKDKVIRFMGKRQFVKMSEFYKWADNSKEAV